MELWEAFERRRSVRTFGPGMPSREQVTKVLSAASLAPSSRNAQPWRFHVATGPVRERVGTVVAQTTVHLAEFADLLGPEGMEFLVGWYSTLGDAPIVVGVSVTETSDDFESSNNLLSVGAAIENVLLAATDEGISVCNVTFSWWVRDELRDAFGIEEGRQVVAVIAMGYSDNPPLAQIERRTDIIDWLE